MKKTMLLAACSLIMTGCSSTNDSQHPLEQRIKELEVNQRIIAQQLNMRSLVTTPEYVTFDDGVAFGNPKAPVAVIEFTDIQCRFCAQFYQDTFAEFKEKYIDTGLVYFVTREMPLSHIHPQATNAAIALRCAADQDLNAFSAMKHELFENRQQLNDDYYQPLAEKLNLDLNKFNGCFVSPEVKQSVNYSYKYAYSMGVSSTPSFIFGKNTGTSVTDYRLGSGAMNMEQLDSAIAIFLDNDE